ncbi:hypothetical protein Tco_1089929 [Tanacetum coccineum]|uniref:Uncharacterized protein n=1 Tax=Tanacetum coccineum TaxID=301880 RepID=A0ABQ5I2Q4_9ASTR
MLEKGNYIPWESRFRKFLENKLEEGERMWYSIDKGPYERSRIPDPDDTTLMYGSDVNNHIRHSRLMNAFDKFAAKEGESLESVYEILTTLVNIMDRNNILPIPMSINTKFLDCLQPEWSKYVTMIKLVLLVQEMDQDSAHMVAASKVPMLKPGEYELWRMRMEQYIQMIDYSLWEVIENGNAPLITKVIKGVETTIAPTTAEEKAQRMLELKARSTLLMGIL